MNGRCHTHSSQLTDSQIRASTSIVLGSQLVVSFFGLNDVDDDDDDDANDVIECSEACDKTLNTLRTSSACIVITLTFMHIKQKGDTSMSSSPLDCSTLIQMWHF